MQKQVSVMSRLVALPFLLLAVVGCDAKKPSKHEMPADWHDEQKARMDAHRMEMEHLSKIPSHKVDDWSVHKDVDDSFYWFSRSLKRSQREPPPGWKKDSNGKWVGPPRTRDEL